MHQRVLQRSGLERRPVTVQARFVQTVVRGEALGHDFQCRVEHRFHQWLANLVPVMGAGEQDERVGVEVFALIQRRALRVDAVEPAAVLGIVKMLLQGTEQRRRPDFGLRHLADQARKKIQLTGAGHGAIALRWQRLMLSVQRLIGQRQVGVPAGALPERHDDVLEMLLHRGEQGGQFRLGGGARNMRHWLASSRQGRLRDMLVERPAHREAVSVRPPSRAGSLPQGNAFQCGSEPARDEASTNTNDVRAKSSNQPLKTSSSKLYIDTNARVAVFASYIILPGTFACGSVNE